MPDLRGSATPGSDRSLQTSAFGDLRGSATPGSTAPAATNQGEAEAMAAAETFRAGAGYPSGVDLLITS